MAYSERQYRQKISLGQSGNALVMLIAICLIMFVGLAFIKAIWYFKFEKDLALPLFNKNVLSLFALPADAGVLINRPWTIITYMFVHDNIWPVITNMLWLFCFGYILQEKAGNKKVIPVFIYGSLAGGLAYILAYNSLPALQADLPFATTLGASAGVMAVAIAATTLDPKYKLFPLLGGGIPLWGLTAFYVLISLLSISFSDTAHILVQLSAAASGFLFIFFLKKDIDGSVWMNNFFEWVGSLFNPAKPPKGKNIKEELFYKATTTPFKKTANLTQQRVDEILDKINQQGYNALSDAEKDLLKRASKEGL